MPKPIFRKLLLAVAFLEGGSVMICELTGAKLLAPYFGNSLYVWASVLAVTLGGLAAGYFLGGMLSVKFPFCSLLFYALFIAGGFLFAMPWLGKSAMQLTLNMSVQWGSFFALLIFLFPPLLFFGMTSPVMINLLTETAETSGKQAGTVYAVSTVGGIVFTLLCGFYILPHYGIALTAMAAGGTLAAISAVYFVIARKYLLLPALAVFWLVPKAKPELNSGLVSVLYRSEGILGEVKVIEHDYAGSGEKIMRVRSLLVNNIPQTIMLSGEPERSLWDYPQFISRLAENFRKPGKALLLGLGGGTLYRQLMKNGFETDAVELDGRIKEAAIKYFHVPSGAAITVDDARHYLRTCRKKYDLIVFDTFRAEMPPAHLLTLECLKELRKNLHPGGIIAVNYYGFYKGEAGKSAVWLYNTFVAAGFGTKIFSTNPDDERTSNLIFVAADSLHQHIMDTYELTNPINIHSQTNLSAGGIFTDDLPAMELLSAEPALLWRKGYMSWFLSQSRW